ncbi:MAG TPA: phosphate ABC transporter substrate-binding protein PstS [Gaiellaceae bacterium]|nr:phosphate ABC transporter substrate-binding protein PstS [Gaiellaceae bacterium]
MRINRTHTAAALAALLVLGLTAAGCGGSGQTSTNGPGAQQTGSSTLVGAGSTLVAPLVAQWESPYSTAKNVTITYGAIGSGGGIAQMTARTVDFGASDAPLTSDQAKACSGCVQIPWALAATTVSYNVPGLTKPLRLTGPVLASIYLGKITNWSDPAITKLNPGLNLPNMAIHVVYRSDGSGDTYAFTSYLSDVSSQWKSQVGYATTVSWPTGTGGKGNAGVAAAIEATPGAVGYVAIGQAVASKLDYAEIGNSAGTFVKPSTASIAAAAATARFTKDNAASIVDPPASAKTAYPISTFTYVIVPRSSSKLAALKEFLTYAVTAGQKDAAPLDFAPLPKNVVAKDKTAIKGL